MGESRRTWLPRSRWGRRAAIAAGASLALLVAAFALGAILAATTGEDEDPNPALFAVLSVAFIGAILSGVFAAVSVMLGFVREGDRSRLAILVVAASAILVPLLVVFVVADILGGTHEGKEIEVRLVDGRIELRRQQGQQDRLISEVDGPFHLVLEIENREDRVQRVGLAELTTGSDGRRAFEPNSWPVVDGQVRHFTYTAEPAVVIWTSGGWSVSIAPGVEPPPRPPDVSIEIQPGETVKLEPRHDDFPPGTTLVIFSDLPGQYEAGQWAVLEIR